MNYSPIIAAMFSGIFVAIPSAAQERLGDTFIARPTAAQEWRDRPKLFLARDPRYRDLPIKFAKPFSKESKLVDQPWPFNADTILIACAAYGMNIVKVKDVYGALNGTTSASWERYGVQEYSNNSFDIVRVNNHDNFRNNGIVTMTATDPAIGHWISALNSILLHECS